MATIIANHRVKDFATGKVLYDSDRARRDEAGMKELAVGEREDDPGNVYLILECADPGIFKGMMNDKELQERMKQGGVISAPEMIILK